MRYIVKNLRDTKKIAKKIKKRLNSVDIICLDGDLGAGKTTFTKYLLRCLGVKDIVSSPTFTIARQYTARDKMMYHFDLYRIKESKELDEIGVAEMLSNANLSIIEWPEIAREYFENYNVLNISISFDQEDNRVFEIGEA